MSTVEIDKKTEFFELGSIAEGGIQAQEHQQERLEEVTEAVGSGRFHVATDLLIPCGCIDGRCGCDLKPNAAGGTLSLVVADDLINHQFASNDKTIAGAYDNVVRFLKGPGKSPIGGHDGPGANSEKTDCGANDKLPLIYAMLVKQADNIRQLAEAVGLEVDDETHERIISRASKRADFSPSTQLLEILKRETERDPTNHIDHLLGEHQEILAVINERAGTTLDRDAVETEFGPNYEVFNIDVWSFRDGAERVSTGDRNSPEARKKEIAMTYYNLATALVLCGPKMRVVVLD